MSLAAKAVYPVLLKHTNRDGLAWPSVKTIGHLANIARSTAHRAITALIEAGLVERVQVGGGNRSTRYHLLHVPLVGRVADDYPSPQRDTARPTRGTLSVLPAAHEPSRQRDTNKNHRTTTIKQEPSNQEEKPTGKGNRQAGPMTPLEREYLLESYGIKGPFLAQMSHSTSLTADRIKQTWVEVQNDPSARNKAAVLVHRLKGG